MHQAYMKWEETLSGLELSREKVAKALSCEPNEIYFTSCGSEADN